LSSAAIILTASLTGGPVGTSQVIASSIVGVGTASRMKGVQWEIFRGICIAWLITIPFTCLLSYLIFTALSYIFNNHPANIS
jgi:PiT family inorganic phosphate transporter